MVLGLPSLGIALAYTFVTAYLPIFIEHLAGAAVTGLMIGGEGIFALFVPFLIGGWSDSLQTSLGKRLPFIFVGTLLIILNLILMPFSTNHLFLLGIELAIFFIGYFTHYAAYYAIAEVLADRYNHRLVILISVIFFAIGAIPPLFNVSRYFIILVLRCLFSSHFNDTPFFNFDGISPKRKFSWGRCCFICS